MKSVIALFAALLLLSAGSFAVDVAQAHGGSQPEHGGVVQVVGDMSFELVTGPAGVELYVEDDGEEVNSAELAAKLTVVAAGARSEVQLDPVGGNKFAAKGVHIVTGAKVAVQLTLKDKQSKIGAYFTVP